MPVSAENVRESKPIPMFTSVQDRASKKTVTCYSCGVISVARKKKVNILISKNNKIFVAKPRMVHKEDLTSTYSNNHPKAGQGKYIDNYAYVDKSRKHILGAHFINPFLADSRANCYATIVKVFQRATDIDQLKLLHGTIHRDFQKGEHIIWAGDRSFDDFVVASPWLLPSDLWNEAQKINTSLLKTLTKTCSPRGDAQSFRSPEQKFIHDLDVLRRATIVKHVNGRVEYCGGATPCAMPLQQCGMAIDKRFLTYDINLQNINKHNSIETAQYYYRMVWGRSFPKPLLKRDWGFETETSEYCFLNNQVKEKVQFELNKRRALQNI